MYVFRDDAQSWGVVVMVNKWANNTKRYLFGLGLTEETKSANVHEASP